MEHGQAHPGAVTSLEPALYVVATPIGNLRDVTLRALDTLRGVQAIAAEDTRVTSRLLAHYGIQGRLIAMHQHNERRASADIVRRIAAGDAVALVSDAGTPAISDPGARLIAAVRETGHPVIPVPGASAALAALSASGLDAPRFLFVGFLPARAAERRRLLGELATAPCALVFYEAPHRVADAVSDLHEVLGGARRIVIARELTKLFETIHVCRLADAGAWMAADANRTRGEFVLIVDAAPQATDADAAELDRVLTVLLDELPLKQAATLAARLTGGARNRIYQRALALRKQA